MQTTEKRQGKFQLGYGVVKRAIPSKEGAHKTFYREYVKRFKSQAMTQAQWLAFLEVLEQINAFLQTN